MRTTKEVSDPYLVLKLVSDQVYGEECSPGKLCPSCRTDYDLLAINSYRQDVGGKTYLIRGMLCRKCAALIAYDCLLADKDESYIKALVMIDLENIEVCEELGIVYA